MPAYVLARVSVSDAEKYQEYGKLAAPSMAKYGGKYLVRGGLHHGAVRGRLASTRNFNWRNGAIER